MESDLKCPPKIGGHLRSSEIGLRRSEVPGQHFVDARDGQIGDAFQHVLQIAFRIDAVQLGRADQRVDCRGGLSAGVRAAEEIVFAVMRRPA